MTPEGWAIIIAAVGTVLVNVITALKGSKERRRNQEATQKKLEEIHRDIK